MSDLVFYPHFRSQTSQSTQIYLVRHGQTTGNQERLLHGRTDSRLSELGRTQAERVAERLAAEPPIDHLLSSPLSRAGDTAAPIGKRHGIETSVIEDLIEMDFGDLEGFTFDRVLAEYPDLARKALDPADQTLVWPNGESRSGFHQRVRQTFQTLVNQHAGNRLAIVSHNGVLGSFLAQLQGNSPDNWMAFRIANCSLSSIEVTEEGTTVHFLNDVAHLGDLVTMITADTLKAP